MFLNTLTCGRALKGRIVLCCRHTGSLAGKLLPVLLRVLPGLRGVRLAPFTGLRCPAAPRALHGACGTLMGTRGHPRVTPRVGFVPNRWGAHSNKTIHSRRADPGQVRLIIFRDGVVPYFSFIIRVAILAAVQGSAPQRGRARHGTAPRRALPPRCQRGGSPWHCGLRQRDGRFGYRDNSPVHFLTGIFFFQRRRRSSVGALLQPAAFLGNGYAVHLRPVLGHLAGLGALGLLPASRSYVNIFYEICSQKGRQKERERQMFRISFCF